MSDRPPRPKPTLANALISGDDQIRRIGITSPGVRDGLSAVEKVRGALGIAESAKSTLDMVNTRGPLGISDELKGVLGLEGPNKGAFGIAEGFRGTLGTTGSASKALDLINSNKTALGITGSPSFRELLGISEKASQTPKLPHLERHRQMITPIETRTIDIDLEAIAQQQADVRRAKIEREERLVSAMEAVEAELVASGEREARAEERARAAEERESDMLTKSEQRERDSEKRERTMLRVTVVSVVIAAVSMISTFLTLFLG